MSLSFVLLLFGVVAIKVLLLAILVKAFVFICRIENAVAKHQAAKLLLGGMLLMPVLVFLVPAIYPVALQRTGNAVGNAVDGQSALTIPTTANFGSAGSLVSDSFDSNRATTDSPAGSSGPFEDQKTIANQKKEQSSVAIENSHAGSRQRSSASAGSFRAESSAAKSSRWFSVSFWSSLALAAYLFGLLIALGRLMVGWIQLQKIVRFARPIDSDLKTAATARVFESNDIAVPSTVGVWDPKILLPCDWREWNESTIEMAIAHESRHVQRWDTLVNSLSHLNRAIYWFHPLAWSLHRKINDLAELACDDFVIGTTGRRNDYAQLLVQMTSRLSQIKRAPILGMGMARTAQIEQRVERILDRDRALSQKPGFFATTIVFAMVALLAVFVASVAGFSNASNIDSSNSNHDNVSDALAENNEMMVGDTAEENGVVRGVVVLPDGSPAADSRVFLRMDGGKREATMTDANGQFEFTDLPSGERRLSAFRDNLSSRSKRYVHRVVAEDESDIKLQLRPVPSLELKVIDKATGAVIPEANIWLPYNDIGRNGFVTDKNGELTIQRLSNEAWRVQVWASGYAQVDQEIAIVGSGSTKVNLVLAEPGADLFGTVVDEAGKPVVGASVYVAPVGDVQERRFHKFAKTDAEGKYQMPSLPLNENLVTEVRMDGFKEPESTVMLTVERGKKQKHDFRIERLPETIVRGTVKDVQGNPIAGAIISGMYTRENHRCESDESGSFELIGPLGTNRVQVLAKGYVGQYHIFPLDESEVELDFELEPGREVVGKVVDERGKPVANVTVDGSKFVGKHNGGYHTVKTDADGGFKLDSLPADSHLRFYKEGYTTVSDVLVPESGVELEPVALPVEGIIRGKVVNSKGEPITRFKMYYGFSPDRRPGDAWASMSMASTGGDLYSNEEGIFEIDGRTKGMPIQVTVEAEGFRKCVIRRVVALADAEAKPVEFRLSPIVASDLFTVSGRIIDDSGSAIAGVEVRMIVSDERNISERDRFPFNWEMIFCGQIAEAEKVAQYKRTTTDADGKFSFEDVRKARDIELVYWGNGVVRTRRPGIHKLSSKERQSMEVTAVLGGTVRGTVDLLANPDASPMIRIGDDSYPSEILDDGKTFEILNVPVGKHEVLIHGNRQPLNIEGHTGAFTTSVIRRIECEVVAGEVARADDVDERP